jgi:hypothetical protein
MASLWPFPALDDLLSLMVEADDSSERAVGGGCIDVADEELLPGCLNSPKFLRTKKLLTTCTPEVKSFLFSYNDFL